MFEEVLLARAVYVCTYVGYVGIYTALDVWYRRHVFCGYGMLLGNNGLLCIDSDYLCTEY